jgi:MOSC domain-containing protein YiiM
MSVDWYVGTDWTKLPAGGSSLRQVFVRLEDYEHLKAQLERASAALVQLMPENIITINMDADPLWYWPDPDEPA